MSPARPKIVKCPQCGHERTTGAGAGMVLKCPAPTCSARYRLPGGHRDVPDAEVLGRVSPERPAPPPLEPGLIPEAQPPAPPEPEQVTSPVTSPDVTETSPPAPVLEETPAQIKGRLGGRNRYRQGRGDG